MKSKRTLFFYIFFLFLSHAGNAQTRHLNYYLENAKKNSPLIHRSINDNKIIALNTKQINAVLSKPEIMINGNITIAPIISHDNNENRFEWVSEGASNYTGYDLAITDGGQYQAGIIVQQPLLGNFKFQSYSDQADIACKINDNNIALNEHELEQIVNYQYILCMKSKKQIELSKAVIDKMKEQVEIMKRLVSNAIYRQSDLTLLQIELENANENYIIFQNEYKSNLYDLNLICAINDTTQVDIQEVNFELKSNDPAYSKFITSYELDSLNIFAEQNIFNQKYKPQLYVFANAGLNASYLPAFNRLGFSTGLSLSWTIFDGNQREIHQQISAVNLNTIEFEKQNFITQIIIQKSKTVSYIHSLEERENIIKDQIKKYDTLVEAYQQELSHGDVSVMDLKNLMIDIFTKKQDLVNIEMQKLALINSYNYWNY